MYSIDRAKPPLSYLSEIYEGKGAAKAVPFLISRCISRENRLVFYFTEGGTVMGASDQIAESWGHSIMDAHLANIQTLMSILEGFLDRRNYTGEDMRGLTVILKHLKKGGNANLSTVDMNNAEAVASILKSLKVPFAVMRDGDTGKCVFVTRDIPRDRELVKEAFKRFAVAKGADLQQIPIDEFLRYNENKQVKHMDGLDAAELEVFRERMKKYSGQYAVIRNEKDPKKFDIYYPNSKARETEGAVKDMAYDFAGKEGRRYRETVEDFLNKKEVFAKKLTPPSEGVLYIVSKSDPTRFITLSADGYAIHRANCQRVKAKDGTEQLSMTDRNPERHVLPSRDELIQNILSHMPDAVILPEEEMPIVKSISANGQCLFVKDAEFQGAYDSLLDRLSGMRAELPLSPAARENLQKPVLTSYLHIMRDQMDTIMDALKDVGMDRLVSIGDDGATYSIAFPEGNKGIQDIVDGVLFAGQTGLEGLNSRLYNEGRMMRESINEPGLVVIDATLAGAAVMMTDKGASIRQGKDGGGETLTTLNRDSDTYEKDLVNIIQGMKEPVVLTTAEYSLLETDPEKFNQILASRIPSEFDTTAEKEYYRSAEQKQDAIYEELHKRGNAVDIDDLPERQQEAMRHFKDYEIRETFIDRTMFEKITELDFSDRKIQETMQMAEETTYGR